jgi:glycine/sarcosine N-methyltransferase
MHADSYKSLARHYDALNPGEEIFKQRPFFERLIARYSVKSCLDCACGPGWHLLMLNELGLDCAGSDISPAMLSLAQENLRDRAIPLKQEDFRTLARAWHERFDMVICMSTSLPHMLTEADAVAALTSMCDRLNPDGILVIGNGITDNLLDTKPKLIPARILEDRAFYFFMEYPDAHRVIFNILFVQQIGTGFEHAFDVVEYNAMRQSTLQGYFARTPFARVEYSGDFDFSEYSKESSQRLIAIAHRGL